MSAGGDGPASAPDPPAVPPARRRGMRPVWRVITAVVLVLVVVGGALIAVAWQRGRSLSATVGPEKATTVRGDDLEISVPAYGVSEAGTLRATPATPELPPAARAGDAYTVQLGVVELRKPATVRLRVSDDLPAGATPWLALGDVPSAASGPAGGAQGGSAGGAPEAAQHGTCAAHGQRL